MMLRFISFWLLAIVLAGPLQARVAVEEGFADVLVQLDGKVALRLSDDGEVLKVDNNRQIFTFGAGTIRIPVVCLPATYRLMGDSPTYLEPVDDEVSVMCESIPLESWMLAHLMGSVVSLQYNPETGIIVMSDADGVLLVLKTVPYGVNPYEFEL